MSVMRDALYQIVSTTPFASDVHQVALNAIETLIEQSGIALDNEAATT